MEAYRNASSPAIDSPENGSPDEDTPGNGFPAVDSPDKVSPARESPDKVSPAVKSPDKGSPDEVPPDKGSPDKDTPDKSRTETWQKLERVMLVAMFLVTAAWYLIMPVEFIIASNRIPGVNQVLQTGQLLPLVASICILCAFGVDLCIETLKKRGKQESNGSARGKIANSPGGGGVTIANSPGVIQDSRSWVKGETEGMAGGCLQDVDPDADLGVSSHIE